MDHQRADRGVMHVPEWGRVHQADAEASGDERREVRVEFCPTHREASRAGGRHVRTLQPIRLGTKKGDREGPGVDGDSLSP